MARGSITRRGDSYLIRIYIGMCGAPKRPRYLTESVRGTKKEAQARLAAKLRELEAGLPAPDKGMLIEYLDRWLNSPGRRASVKARTHADKRDLVNRYVRQHPIGQVPIDQLTPLHLQEVYDELLARGLSAGTVRNLHAVFSKSLRQAVRWRLIPSSPAPDVELPAGKTKKGALRPFTPEEALRFLGALAGELYGPLFHLALASGMRPGEVLGLHWEEVDFKASSVRVVDSALVRVPKESGYRLEPPKTPESRRTVVLPAEVMAELRRHGDGKTRGFVFTGRTGQPLDERNLVKRHFKRILRKAGIPAHHTLYDLRHTCATLLLLAGTPPKVVSERLGHASIKITMDTYSSVLPTMQQGASDDLAQLLYPDREAPPS